MGTPFSIIYGISVMGTPFIIITGTPFNSDMGTLFTSASWEHLSSASWEHRHGNTLQCHRNAFQRHMGTPFSIMDNTFQRRVNSVRFGHCSMSSPSPLSI
jgi:hypothetical protein